MVITRFNDNDDMMLVVDLVVVFMVNFAINKMGFKVDYTHTRGPCFTVLRQNLTRQSLCITCCNVDK